MITFFEIQPGEEVDEILQNFEKRIADKAYFDVDELEDIIDHFFEKGYIPAAANAIELGRQLHPNNNDIQLRQAKLYAIQGKLEEALQLTEEIDKIEHNDLENMMLRGEILLRLDKDREAETVFDNLLQNELENKELLCLDIANIYMNIAGFNGAERFLRIGYEANPKNLDVMLGLAFVLQHKNEDSKEAIEIYNRMIDLEPYSVEAWFNLGQTYMAQGKPDKAVEAFGFVTAIDDTNMNAWLQKAHAYFENENYQKAIDTYSVFLEKTENKEFPLLYIGECYEEMEQYYKAMEYYDKALEINPDFVDAYLGLSTCMLAMECFAECLTCTDQALLLEPSCAETWIYRAEAYIGLEKIDDAIAAYEKSLKLDDTQVETYIALGNLYLDKGDYYNSLYCFQNAENFEVEIENLHLFLAINYCKLEQYPQMLVHLIFAIIENKEAYDAFLEFCPEMKEEK